MLEYTLKRYEAECGVEDFVSSCVDVPKFVEFCKKCPRYERNWMCPPFDFDPMDVWKNYKRVKLAGVRLDFLPRESSLSSDDVASQACSAIEFEKGRLLEQQWEEERNAKGSVALSAGTCRLCGTCAKITGEPCRKPELARHSIESMGGDVGFAAKKYLGLDLLWIKDGVVPEYLSLVGALLTKE